jgi:hypothetical protein
MIHKNIYVEVSLMVKYTLVGALIGATVGYVIPPGSFFCFIIGSIGGYVAGQYINYRRY